MHQTNETNDAATPTHQSRRHVRIGEYAVTDAGCELATYGLGSCLGVALYDTTAGVAGLAHIKRPSALGQQNPSDAVFADPGIAVLYREMESHGATRRHTVAKLAGGADMRNDAAAVGRGIGERNIEQAVETLDRLEITIAAMDVGGEVVRSIYFDGAAGAVTIETTCGDRYRI
jgi:chemotaxis protein CheD